MFHAKDGLTFERAAGGHVIIMVKTDDADWQEIDIDPDTWTSAIAAMAYLPTSETEAEVKTIIDNIHFEPNALNQDELP